MKPSRFALHALTAALVLTTAAFAQLSIEPPGAGGGTVPIAPPTAAPLQPESRPAATLPAMPSADSVLQQLLSNQGATGSGPAALVVPDGPQPDAAGLLREGQQIDLFSGRLRKAEGGEMFFDFEPRQTPAYSPMGVVPSRRLAAMEDAAGFAEGRSGSDMVFRISAEVTQYRGRNYLYIKPNGIPLPPPVVAPVPSTTQPLVQPVAPGAPAVTALSQGNVITNRVGRLVRDTKTGVELFVFDADGRQMTDPPMGVIPCKLLAVIEDSTDHGNKPGKFRLSGEVTTYRGRNYLYLKALTKITDLNQGIGAARNVGG